MHHYHEPNDKWPFLLLLKLKQTDPLSFIACLKRTALTVIFLSFLSQKLDEKNFHFRLVHSSEIQFSCRPQEFSNFLVSMCADLNEYAQYPIKEFNLELKKCTTKIQPKQYYGMLFFLQQTYGNFTFHDLTEFFLYFLNHNEWFKYYSFAVYFDFVLV